MFARQKSFTARSYSRDTSVFCASCLFNGSNKKTVGPFLLGTKIQLKNRNALGKSILQRTVWLFAVRFFSTQEFANKLRCLRMARKMIRSRIVCQAMYYM